MKTWVRLVALALITLGTGCAQLETTWERSQEMGTELIETLASAANHDRPYWNGDGVKGSPKIVVRLGEQRAYFYKGRKLVGETPISSGKPGFGTPIGRYSVIRKSADHVSSAFGDYVDDAGNVVKANVDVRKDKRPPGTNFDGAKMPYSMHFKGGYAMHQGYVPPYAASHGCIRIPKGMARKFFDAARVGTPVIVRR